MAEKNEESSLPPAKRSKRNCHFDCSWIKEIPGIGNMHFCQPSTVMCSITKVIYKLDVHLEMLILIFLMEGGMMF